MKTIIEKKVEDAVDKTFMEKREKIEKYYKEKYPNDFKSKFKKLYDMDYTSLQKEFNRLKNQLKESNIKESKMKRSELTEFIKEEIISVLSESTEEEVEKTKELTAATKELAKAKKEAGISEEMDDDEADKAASAGAKGKDAKGMAAQHSAELSKQKMKQKMKQKVAAFKDEMVKKGIVGDNGKILDTAKYKEEFAKFKSKKK